MSDRAFYGGEAIGATIGGGGSVVGGRYTGSEAETAARAPWKCPACGVEQSVPFGQPCASCGSGKPAYHAGIPSPQPQSVAGMGALPVEPGREGRLGIALTSFDDWIRHATEPNLVTTENRGILQLAFLAGWVRSQGHTMPTAPLLTVDVPLTGQRVEGKNARTLIAALEIFRDHYLVETPEEVTTGEWCSAEEVTALIAELKAGA